MKWTKKQRKALKDSIAHWERMRDYRKPLPQNHESPWADDCACCQAFLVDDGLDSYCTGCPIYAFSGEHDCENTPYYDTRQAWHAWTERGADRRKWVRAAQEEIDFLKSVLEKGNG